MIFSNYDILRDRREDEDFAIERAETLGATEYSDDEMAQLEANADFRTARQMKRIQEVQRGFE